MKLASFSDAVFKRFSKCDEPDDMSQTTTPLLHSKNFTAVTGVMRSRSARVGVDTNHRSTISSFPSKDSEQRGSFVKAVNQVKTQVRGKDGLDDFFPENICQKRAIFMLVQLKKQILVPLLNQNHPDSIMPLLQIIGDRLYTFFYAVKILPPEHHSREVVVSEALRLGSESGLPSMDCGVRETAYSVYYALNQLKESYCFTDTLINIITTKARNCVQGCIERELKLKPMERESMYIFQPVIANTSYPDPQLLPLSN